MVRCYPRPFDNVAARGEAGLIVFDVRGRVLVLDGNQRSALAAVRALGRRGIDVIVGESSAASLAGHSKYCCGTVVYGSAYDDPERFLRSLAELVRAHDIGVLLPMTDVTASAIVRRKSQFADVQVPLPPPESFDALTNKSLLTDVAAELGVPTPLSVCIHDADEVPAALQRLAPPFVIKPVHSKIWCGGRWIATGVQYADSNQELRDIIARTPWLECTPVLIQEFVRGEGQGVFALYDQGRPVAWFAHRRVREKPPSGGVSVVCESVPVDPQLQEYARRLLSHVNWHGVAMVEFKVTPAGRPYLIEVNGRFWGSLQLAVDAGVDFPSMLYDVAAGNRVASVADYRVGVRSRWLLGDLDHLYLVLKNRERSYGAANKLQTVARFLNFFERRTRFEINRWDDMKPFMFELKNYLSS